MNAPRARSRTATALQCLLWLWLVGLSALAFISLRATGDLAGREPLDSALRQLQLLEVRVEELQGVSQSFQSQPQAATAAALDNTRQALEARLAELEQALAERSTAAELTALRAEFEQLKTRQAPRQAAPAPVRAPRPVPAPTKVPEPAFRVVGLELRAGQRSVSVAPATGEWSADQIQVVLPGEAVDQWRLEAIDGDTAVFRAGEQTRRLAIP
ncbi:Methyl-accepting chemotaxis protein [plant metagenome]|uniref:Methyl-accepting chemotaxis protein n=1 Tax=plant metagenome TaxID=1297885 RepID=A0A484PEB9_9ZZZZ